MATKTVHVPGGPAVVFGRKNTAYDGPAKAKQSTAGGQASEVVKDFHVGTHMDYGDMQEVLEELEAGARHNFYRESKVTPQDIESVPALEKLTSTMQANVSFFNYAKTQELEGDEVVATAHSGNMGLRMFAAKHLGGEITRENNPEDFEEIYNQLKDDPSPEIRAVMARVSENPDEFVEDESEFVRVEAYARGCAPEKLAEESENARVIVGLKKNPEFVDFDPYQL